MVSTCTSTLSARRLVHGPPFPFFAYRVNVCVCAKYMGLEVRISSLIDCNFVMWQLVTTGVDFITNFKVNEKAPELARGRIKAVYSHYTGIKADPLSFKISLSIPSLNPIFLTPTLPFFSLSTLIWWYHRLGLHNLPVGAFLQYKERFSFYPSFALYHEECCFINK